jgi:LTXXQ motif family protein
MGQTRPGFIHTMTVSRRFVVALAAFGASVAATGARAQFGGRQRTHGDQPTGPSRRSDQAPRAGGATPADPIIAIERELPSMRIDLKLTIEQAALFDGLEREVRDAADAARFRSRHVIAFRTDDGASVPATSVFGTIADDDGQRADATRRALDKLNELLPSLTEEQRRQFDRRIIQSLREPLGTS